MKRLVTLISTKGKTPQQVAQEANKNLKRHEGTSRCRPTQYQIDRAIEEGMIDGFHRAAKRVLAKRRKPRSIDKS